MSRIAIIHFQPIELYPPILNLLRLLDMEHKDHQISVYTTRMGFINIKQYQPHSADLKVIVWGRSGNDKVAISRYWNYLYFNLCTLLYLILSRPEKIVYYETLSVFPAYIYRKYFNRSCEVYIHYHEYTSPREYSEGMKLSFHFHQLEKWLYPTAAWISHTNSDRMKKFALDLSGVAIANQQILPNFPPRSWHQEPQKRVLVPLKVVYVGSFSLETMYVKEFAEWVDKQRGDVVWDIYAINYTMDVKEYVTNLKSSSITLHDGVDYESLPLILKNYDVGVILYRGHISNYVYNAPNKLFEYMACGLDVWFPDIMLSCLPYCTKNEFPSVMAIHFESMEEFDWEQSTEHAGKSHRGSSYYCEDALEPLMGKLLKKSSI